MSRAVQSNVFLVGSGALADSLAKLLGTLVSERATCDQGPARARTLAPKLILLAGDAASDRGAALLERLAQNVEPPIPVIVICAPALASAFPQSTPRHVALVTPEGGMNECARRVRAVVEMFMDEGLAACSFQQLADTVAAATRQRLPLAPEQIKQANVTQPMTQLAVKRTPTVSSATMTSPTAATKSAGMPALKFPARPAPALTREVTAELTALTLSTQVSAARPVEPATQPRQNRGIVAAAAAPAQPLKRAALPETGPAPLQLTAASTPKVELSPRSDAVTAKQRTITISQARAEQPSPAATPPSLPKTAELVQPQATPQLPAGMSTAKKPADETAPAQAAPRPTRQTAFGISPPSAATSSAATNEVTIARREPPPLAGKPQATTSITTSAKPAAVSGERAPPEIASSLSMRPTSPPEADEPSADKSAVESAASDRPTNPPARQASFFVAKPPLTSATEPAKQTTEQRSVTIPSVRRRVANPLEPAPAPVPAQRSQAAPERKPAAVTLSAEMPDIAVSFSEPPAPAQPSVEPARARKPRRAVNPFEPAPQAQPTQRATRPTIAQANVASPNPPARRKSLPPAPLLIAEPLQLSPKPRSRKLVPLLCLAAVIGCGSVLFALLSGTSTNSKGATVALAALPQAESVPTTSPSSERVPLQTAQPAPIPSASAQAPQTKDATATVAATGATPSTRKPAHELEPVSEPGSAAALVDEGLALFKDKRLGLAEASYLKALKLQPGFPRAMAALVRVHIERRDGAEAVRWAKQLVEAQPENGAYLLLLGDAQKLRGDLAAAQDAWTEAADKGNVTARERL